jgi:hypothetical protein
MSYSGLPVQHTDDAASQVTRYLRRRCFNCHTTEPPSWRRSTLNPGKIVCNKCGLHERTHLRPRPLRFDELCTGNKARKQSKSATLSPKATKISIKREPRKFGLVRRASVSSASASSDWDNSGAQPILSLFSAIFLRRIYSIGLPLLGIRPSFDSTSMAPFPPLLRLVLPMSPALPSPTRGQHLSPQRCSLRYRLPSATAATSELTTQSSHHSTPFNLPLESQVLHPLIHVSR